MRIFALGLIILTDIIILATHDMEVNSTAMSILLSMIVVVVLAFAISALLRNFKNLAMTRNYLYSGIIGVILGIVFFFWVGENAAAMVSWFEANGLKILLMINLIAALFIFFVTKHRQKTEVQPG